MESGPAEASYDHAVADNQLAIVDPSGRLIGELSAGAAAAGIALRSVALAEPADGCAAVLV
ncbi:MAG TPA: hypothetical protein VHT91_47280, partial [Kofleriaceae bacterium]|nr:hypothetical protein [Kofleriaceae bacterium]